MLFNYERLAVFIWSQAILLTSPPQKTGRFRLSVYLGEFDLTYPHH